LSSDITSNKDKTMRSTCMSGGSYPSFNKVLPPPEDGWKVTFLEARRKATVHQTGPDTTSTVCGVLTKERKVVFHYRAEVSCGNCKRVK
jgi:hypothetical protein